MMNPHFSLQKHARPYARLIRSCIIALMYCCLLPALGQELLPLPEGNTGIAARYPGDSGIAGDSGVVFADDFEEYSSAAELTANWNGGVYHNVRVATEAGKVYAGRKAVEFRCPRQTAELSNTVARDLAEDDELEIMFLRYYTKFDASFDISGSCHNGGGISAHYFINGRATPGVPADGYNKFLAEFESWRATDADTSPGLLNVYIYHPEQRSQWGDHFFPNGEVMPNTSIPGNFGDTFIARPQKRCMLGTWYCCEMMVKANTPGMRDGRIACWLDGVLIADFPNLRLRDTDTLTINRSLHAGTNPAAETWKYYDNVVAATSYIGPMVSAGPLSRRASRPPDFKSRLSIHGAYLSFYLEHPDQVAIELFTPRGRLVHRLARGSYAAGCHRIQLHGQLHGHDRANGVYHVRMNTSETTETRAIALTK
jgi:hypothetical protein